MKSIKKIGCIAMAVVTCFGMMRMTTSADVIKTKSERTEGGDAGYLYVVATAEKTYVTPATGGFFGYDYTTYCKYNANTLIADKWEIDGIFFTNSTRYEKSAESTRARGAYVSETLSSSEEQIVFGCFDVVAESSTFGDGFVQLNVSY